MYVCLCNNFSFFSCNLLTYLAILIIVRSVYYHLRENIKTLTKKEEDEKEQQSQ